MKTKYYIILIAILTVFISIYFLINDNNDKQEHPKILSQLEAKDNKSGEKEFEFSITNVSKDKVKLEFPTWLEYNISINNLDGQVLHDNDIVIEHKDLNLDSEGRNLLLKPNETIHYTIIVHHNIKGNYEISINSAAILEYGVTHNETYIIE